AGGNNNSICLNFEGGYECQSPCAAGFKASPLDGSCIDIDECELNTADCATGQECINSDGSYECQETCAKGYQPNDSGVCQDIDECVTQPCKAPMTCKNLLGSHACVCPKGFPIINGTCEGLVVDSEHPFKVLDYSSDAQNCPAGYYFEKGKCLDTDECAFDAPCAYKCTNIPGNYQCECPTGYVVGENGICAVLDYSSDAQNCPAGYYFEKGKCLDTDECAFDAPCAYKCTNIPGNYQCECPTGYVVGENGICADIDECAFENACTGSELCFNELGSYSCLAKPCPRKFRFNLDTFQCVPICKNCSSTPINLHLLPVKHGLPAETPLIRLTAHDHDGRVLRKSSFKIKTPTEFFLRPDLTAGGSATVLNKHKLTSGTRHQIAIHSISVSHDRKIKYKTDFLVFVSVSQYPF
uniref:EGF-like domain-containing protein n=1 Tax=Panagrolaimus sp. ES5 TaxID=591445 RepID=A0AC34FNE0_9BILA